MRRYASLFAGLAMTAAVAAGVIAWVVGFLSSSATIGIRGALESVPRSELALVIAMPFDEDSAQADRTVADTLRATFHDGARAIPIDLDSTVEAIVPVASPITRSGAAQSLPRVLIANASGLHSDAHLTSGRWAATPSEATLQADAATALGVAVGDTLTIGDTDVTLVGTWRVADPGAARWIGDEAWMTGAAGVAKGPLIIDPSVWGAAGGLPVVHWVIVPDIARIEATDLSAIRTAWAATPDALTAAGLQPGSRSGQFLDATQDLGADLAAQQTAVPLALVLFSVIAGLAIWELAGLVARTREAELSLLWSRGDTAVSLAAHAAGEAAAVTAIGCVVGVGTAALAVGALRGTDAASSAFAAGLWSAAATIAVTSGAIAVRTARGANAGAATGRAGRAGRFVGLGAVVLLLAAAALSTWQLLTHGPVTGAAGIDAHVDPLTIVSPALLLASIVMLGLYASPTLARGAERIAVRKMGNALAVRNVARRIGAAAATIVALGLAVGQLTFAAGYGTTWADSFSVAEQLRAGAALRLEGLSSGLSGAQLEEASSATGVVGVAPVREASVAVGGEQANLLGVAAPAVAALGQTGDGLIDVESLSESIAPRTPLLMLPRDATTITIDAGTSAATPASVWLSDDWGRLQNVPLVRVPATAGSATARIPSGREPWSIAAVDLTPTGTSPAAAIGVESITTDAGPVDPVLSVRVRFGESGRDPAGPLVRLLPPAPVAGAALSDKLARRVGATVGSPLTLTLSSTVPPIETEVSAVVPAIPGGADASTILIDASVMDAAMLRTTASPDKPSIAWVGSIAPAGSAQALRDGLAASISVRELGAEPDAVMLTAGATALWFAAVAGALLAVIGLTAVCATQHRERRAEVGVLRALGMSAAGQAAVRRRELALVTSWGALCGLMAGAVTLLVVVATLARAAIPDAYGDIATPPRIDLSTGSVALLALGIAVAIVIALAGAAVARTARSSSTLMRDA